MTDFNILGFACRLQLVDLDWRFRDNREETVKIFKVPAVHVRTPIVG